MKKKVIFILALVVLFVPFITVLPVQAEDDLLGVGYGQYSGLGHSDVRLVIARIIRVVLGLLGMGAIVLMLYAGFTWMTSMGNQEKIDKAKKTIFGAAIGLAIILSAYAITNFILKTFYQSMGYFFF